MGSVADHAPGRVAEDEVEWPLKPTPEFGF